MKRVAAKFDGRVFVPAEPVDVPAGSLAEVLIYTPPPPPTPEQLEAFEEIRKHLEANPALASFND
jgi:hypothetical protein